MVEYQVMLNSSAMAQQIARGLVTSGVTEVVIAPGSRSGPLVYALAPLAEAGVIRTHVRIDERDAGFLALGLARGHRAKQGASGAGHAAGTGAAVALVTTSGSAVANLHPAVLEASYGHLPLIAITADRPARLRATGANQTIDDQSQVLSDVRGRVDVPAGSAEAAHLLADAVARARGNSHGPGGDSRAGESLVEAGPVQFNVQFDVPLVPTVAELADWQAEVQTLAARATSTASGPTLMGGNEEARTSSIRILPGTVIVAGDASGHSADSLKSLAEDCAVPVLAEPSSPLTYELRDSNCTVPAHARVLTERADLRKAIRTVIVHGKPTLTRPVAALLNDPGVLVQRLPDDVDAVSLEITVDDGKTNSAEGLTDDVSATVETAHPADHTSWREAWANAGRAIVAESRHEREASLSTRPSRQAVAQTAARAITEHLAASAINLFAASSNAIRYLNEATDVRAHIHASRGLAGIDGLISTATGLSLALGEQVVLVIGDVAMLHDVGGLLTPSTEEEGDVLIIVLNDDGGAIFSGLEHSQDHVAPYLDRYFTVAHGRDFRSLASAYGWGYVRVGALEGSVIEAINDFIAEFNVTNGGADSGHGTGRLGRRIVEVDLT